MARRDLKSLDMIRTLISYDTTSRDSNLALIDFVRDYLSKLGVESELIVPYPHSMQAKLEVVNEVQRILHRHLELNPCAAPPADAP